MKIYGYLLGICSACLLASCNTDEGLGGSSSIEGYVYEVIHYDDNFSFATDTFPAIGKKVYINFGNESALGDDVDTGFDGYYRFNYLTEGNYTVYSTSSYNSGKKEAVVTKVKASGRLTKADTLFIHSGKAFGTSMIKGTVYATYYHNGSYRAEGPAQELRVYIRHAGEEAFYDDARIVDGIFIIQKVVPGRYEIGVPSEDKDTEAVTMVIKPITVTEAGVLYTIDEQFNVNVAV
ncbi:hypothetical protein AGMMS4957_02200 [Bacteroidia bacterium]|nr:hypothetical protein AGMMS4957_02200 [Bacteroidia bacterium]